MKAAVLREVGHLDVVELDTPSCPDGGLLLESRACSICSTDVHMYRHGHHDLVLPRIIGHEISGRIAEVGDKVEGVKKGERIQLAPGVACGGCRPCMRGHPNMCEHMKIFGFHLDGGFAEYVGVPEEALHAGCLIRIPPDLPYEQAALAEPLACCINAQELTRVGAGDTVAIIGAGPVGCLNAMLAKARGAERVFLIDMDSSRLEQAGKAMDVQCVDASSTDAVNALRSFCPEGVDVVIIACRDSTATQDGIRMAGKNGKVCLFSGAPSEHMPMRIDTNELHYTQRQLVGAYGCTSAQCGQAIELMASKSVDVDWLITHRICLDDVGWGIKLAESKKSMKVVVGY
ncbi:MAG: alcohol dehydrogenase catalytic domain-containing protein [Methermicoccaceae archaeon]